MRLVFRDAILAVRKQPLLSALSITTIAFSLFAFALFGLVAINIKRALEGVEERVEIRAFLADNARIESVASAANEIARYNEVSSATIVTSEQALERARKELGEFSDVFEAGVLPASIDIRLKPGFRDPRNVSAVASRVRTIEFIDDVRFGEEWIAQLYKLRNLAGVTGIVLGLAFAIVAVIIIGATIRMTVLSRAREISIMKLVGATDSFIRSPFLLDGFAKGVLGGVLALLMSWAASEVLERYLGFHAVFFDQRMIVYGLIGGAVLGVFGSGYAVSRHLRQL